MPQNNIPSQVPLVPANSGENGGFPSLESVLGFVTEFNENVAIFNQITDMLLGVTLLSDQVFTNMAQIETMKQSFDGLKTLDGRIESNTNAIWNVRRNLEALAQVQRRQDTSADDPRNTQGYSSDNGTGPV